jgi:hypothetical protein
MQVSSGKMRSFVTENASPAAEAAIAKEFDMILDI